MRSVPGDFLLELASWSADQAALESIRRQVFMEEQGFAAEEEWDDLEPVCTHVLATTMLGEPIGTARLTPDGQLGRLAVLPPWRGTGVGKALIAALEDAAQSQGLQKILLGAQDSATGFYERLGYRTDGRSYVDGGRLHLWMEKTISPATPAGGPRMEIRDRVTTDIESEASWFDSNEALFKHYVELIEGARRKIDVYTRDLEARTLDRDEIVAGLIALATAGRGRQIRILVEDTLPALDRGHRFIDLSQRLSTAISIRVPASYHRGYVAAYAIADARHVIYRESAAAARGQWLPDHPQRARQLLVHFDEVWAHSEPEPHFQYLGL